MENGPMICIKSRHDSNDQIAQERSGQDKQN